MDINDRFWSKVNIADADSCWEWQAFRTDEGYGQFTTILTERYASGRLKVKTHIASRLAFELAHGAIPEGYCVRHTCDNPPCCNPKHLILGDQEQNIADRIARRRSASGANNGRAKLTDEQVREIRYVASNQPRIALARQFNVSPSVVRNIVSGKTWKHVV